MAGKEKIVYTYTDEAPALATHSLLPVIQSFTKAVGVEVELWDISLAGRIIANFPEALSEAQRMRDALTELGELAKRPEANIIKLPNISASIPQMKACIAELQSQGYTLPDYPEEPQNNKERDIKARYDKIKGSAVNPVLREGNSDRRAPESVKQYARKHPHSMGTWSSTSKSHVSSMPANDFFGNEKSVTIDHPTSYSIEFTSEDGSVKMLKEPAPLLAGEVIDGTYLSKEDLEVFLSKQVEDAKANDVLLSIHLKATMMKVSDPILFGHMVKVYFRDLFAKHNTTFCQLGVDVTNGFGDVIAKIKSLPEEKQREIEADIQACYSNNPRLAMVNSDKGITNLHVPSDVIIDASMPAAIRSSGKMWGPDGKLKDTKFVIPDRSYAGVYQATVDFCKSNGAFDPRTMGSVPNVGLMAQKAEEYGSHDKTFELPSNGTVRVKDSSNGKTLIEHQVKRGDIWRMCQAKDAPIRDWVKLAVTRARATHAPAVFWLDEARAHDSQLMKKVSACLKEHDTTGLDIRIMNPADATRFSLQRMKEGKDTISVTGNVLRDYLTDLFPILEVGTSAKMLSIVPLMNGGGLFETGAGGSAPKHVEQFVKENHLRWDSLGEFLALTASLDHLHSTFNKPNASVLAKALDSAIEAFLENNKSPSAKVSELDNRGSHFYLTLYWAKALSAQTEDLSLRDRFMAFYAKLSAKEEVIVREMLSCQGVQMNLGGYYHLDERKVTEAMRPSATFNSLLMTL